MTETPQIRVKAAWKAWIAIRFIVFGIGGFLTVWVSWLSVLFVVMDQPFRSGATQLRWCTHDVVRRRTVGTLPYLWVFVSVPIVVSP